MAQLLLQAQVQVLTHKHNCTSTSPSTQTASPSTWLSSPSTSSSTRFLCLSTVQVQVQVQALTSLLASIAYVHRCTKREMFDDLRTPRKVGQRVKKFCALLSCLLYRVVIVCFSVTYVQSKWTNERTNDDITSHLGYMQTQIPYWSQISYKNNLQQGLLLITFRISSFVHFLTWSLQFVATLNKKLC